MSSTIGSSNHVTLAPTWRAVCPRANPSQVWVLGPKSVRVCRLLFYRHPRVCRPCSHALPSRSGRAVWRGGIWQHVRRDLSVCSPVHDCWSTCTHATPRAFYLATRFNRDVDTQPFRYLVAGGDHAIVRIGSSEVLPTPLHSKTTACPTSHHPRASIGRQRAPRCLGFERVAVSS